MSNDVDLIGGVYADYSLGRHRGFTDDETQERAERALSWLVEEVESLQAQLAAKETTLNGTYISMEAHEREVKKLKAEIGYEQDSIACRNTICNGNREGMYRKCAELEELLEAAIAGQETLQKALAESQRRERAAVEDMKAIIRNTGPHKSACDICSKPCGYEGLQSDWCDHFRWRGTDFCSRWRGPEDGE